MNIIRIVPTLYRPPGTTVTKARYEYAGNQFIQVTPGGALVGYQADMIIDEIPEHLRDDEFNRWLEEIAMLRLVPDGTYLRL